MINQERLSDSEPGNGIALFAHTEWLVSASRLLRYLGSRPI
jgi:hypothetical protein